MAKFVVTCPDRRGAHQGFYSAVGFFSDGQTLVELSPEQLDTLKGEISRKESILVVEAFDAKKHAALVTEAGKK